MVNFLSQVEVYLNSLFSQTFSKLFVFLFIVLAGFVVGKLLGRILQKVLHEFGLDALLEKAGFAFSFEHTAGVVFSYVVYFGSLVYALFKVGLGRGVLVIIGIVSLILIIISTVVGIKEFIPNVIAGISLYRKGLLKKGASIGVGSVEGVIQRVGLVDVELRTGAGDVVYVPNVLISRSLVVKKA